jgi:hypothetical protein
MGRFAISVARDPLEPPHQWRWKMKTAVAGVVVTISVLVLLLLSSASVRDIPYLTHGLPAIDRRLIVASFLMLILAGCTSAHCNSVIFCWSTSWYLARRPDVYHELKLTAARRKLVEEKLREFVRRNKAAMKWVERQYAAHRPAAAEVVARSDEIGDELDRYLAEALTPDDMERFKQIRIQNSGFAAFIRPDVQRRLQLTSEQLHKKQQIEEDVLSQIRIVRYEYGRTGKRAHAKQQIANLDIKSIKAMLESLSDEQQRTWKELTGEEIKIHGVTLSSRLGIHLE